MLERFDFVDGGAIVAAVVPVNLATAAVNGPWVGVPHLDKLYILVVAGAGTAGEDPVITLEQATAAAGTGAKALSISELHYQVAADITAERDWTRPNGADAATEVDRQNKLTEFDSDSIAGAENQLAVLIGVYQHDLDVNNGFTHVRAKIADVGTGAQLGAMFYLAKEKLYRGSDSPDI